MSWFPRSGVRMWVLGIAAAFLLFVPSFGQESPPEKIKIETLDDLPRHTYKIEGSVSELLQSPDEAFAEFAAKVRADIEGDLAKYQIDDAATLQSFYNTLLAIDLLDERYDDALQRIELIRALEDKEALKMMTGLTAKALIAACEESGKSIDDPEMRAAFARQLGSSIEELPWDLIQDEIESAKGRAEIFSESFVMGIVQARYDQIVAKSGELSSDIAGNVVGIRFLLKWRLPLKEELISIYSDAIEKHKVDKPDIWAARAVALTADQNLHPVVIGIWDSGVDATIFSDQMFVNPNETVDGWDNDRNGFVDDLHGIAFDLDGRRTPEMLYPLGAAADRIGGIMEYMKGFSDVQAALDSPEASALKQHISTLKSEEVNGFIEDLMLCGSFMHGTHVAGIAIDGNPFARILIARNMFDYHNIPKPLTSMIAVRHAQSYRDTARYFRQHGVRVVNMSWGWTLKEIESGLEANAIGATAEERAALASTYLGILRKGLYDAIAGSPDILFINAAGNEDSDVEFDEVIPSSFDLPNLLIVGAVDQAGEPTSFTSSGRNVVVYANGFEVDSYVPGGKRMKASGTSMASPNVMNLAAKLVAVRPTLTPTQIIDSIKQGADRKEGQLSYLLINPKRTVALLHEEQ